MIRSRRMQGAKRAVLTIAFLSGIGVTTQLCFAASAGITMTCDDRYDLYVNAVYIGSQNSTDGLFGWDAPETWSVTLPQGPNVIAVHASDLYASGSGVGC